MDQPIIRHDRMHNAPQPGSRPIRPPAESALSLLALLIVSLVLGSGQAGAQSLDDLLNEEELLKGISDLAQPGALDRYLAAHPPTNSADDLRYRLAAARASLGDPSTDRSQRQEKLNEVLALRRRLIEQNANHPRRAIWMADQAADLYFVQLPIDGCGLTALYGLPTAEQRRLVAQAAAEMDRLTSLAEQEIERAITAVESMPGYQQNAALQDRRRELDETERRRRIPFLRGVAACLHAELNLSDEAARRRMFALSSDVLGPVSEELEGPLAAQARVYAGLALVRLARADQADQMLRAVAADTGAEAADAFAGGLIMALNRANRDGAAGALQALNELDRRYASPGDLFYRVLIVDQRFRLRQSMAQEFPLGPQRDAALAQAFQAYLDLLNDRPRVDPLTPAPAADPRVLRGIVLARLVVAAGDDTPLAHLPALVTVARASAMADDPPARPRAIQMLESVVENMATDEPTRAAALFALGQARWAAGQPLLAAEAFLKLARDHSTDVEAARAIELAVTMAAAQHARDSADADNRRLLIQALQLLLDRYPDLREVERWRLLAGELALTEGRLDDAQAHLAAVPGSAAQWLDAQFMQAATARARLAQLPPDRASRPDIDQALAVIQRVRSIVEDRLVKTTETAQGGRLLALAARLMIFEAEARLAAGQFDLAVALAQGIERDARLPSDVIGEALRVRIAAGRAAGRSADVQQQLRKLMEKAPEQLQAAAESVLASLTAEVAALLEAGQAADALARAQAELVPVAGMIDEWLASESTAATRVAASSTTLRRALADAYQFGGRWSTALAHYDHLLHEQPANLELLLGRAECLMGLGSEPSLAEAMTIYKRLAAARSPARDACYWQSQLRMLQILDRLNRNTQQIVPQIRRLRLVDPQLGGPRFRGQFEALQNKAR